MTRDIGNLGPDMEKALAKAVNKVTLSVNEKLVETTPVKTGFARASWIPSVGAPSSSVGGSPEAPSTGPQSAGQASVATNGQVRTLHITNNTEYIQKLNDGHSSQQPALFVERSIEAGIRKHDGDTIR